MPVKTGRLAELRRAVDRIDPSAPQSFEPDEHISSSLPLPRELTDELRKLETEELLEILHGGDAQISANRDVHRFVSDLVRLRTRDEDLTSEEDLAAAEAGLEQGPGEEHEFFVGWAEAEGGSIEMVSQTYQPSNRAHIAHETLQRYRNRERAGGFLGKLSSRADLAEAARLQLQNDRWSGRTLSKMGEVKAKELVAALKAIISPALENVLRQEGNDVVTMCIEGHQAILLTKDGHIHQLSRLETRHLALVGILPRHWFLPLMWWKQMMMEDEEQLAQAGRSKKRIYKGRYDDDDADGEGGDKEDKE